MTGWVPLSFDEIGNWRDDDHLAAIACFRMSAKAYFQNAYISRKGVASPEGLKGNYEKALSLNLDTLTREMAREFFEANFQPMKLDAKSGFVTAYFEPEVPASRIRTDEYTYPLLKRPDDLVKLSDENQDPALASDLEYARQTKEGLVEFYDRGEIDNGALSGRHLELFWLRSVVDGFYIHIQGSARLLFSDDTSARVSFAGKTGHPYTSIGKVLVERGVMTVEDANMTNIRAWLEADEKRALELLHQNRSFIFFTEVEGHQPDFGPIAAAGVQLTPGRSLAVDKTVHAYGTPIWIATDEPLPSDTQPFTRLMIAQDTGSAIVGPKRGDLFIGSGDEAGLVAGSVRHSCKFIAFHPRSGG